MKKPFPFTLFPFLAGLLLASCGPTSSTTSIAFSSTLPSEASASNQKSEESLSRPESKESSSESSLSGTSLISMEKSSSEGDVSSEASKPASSHSTSCEEHDYKEVIIKKATIISKGIKALECSNCGERYGEEEYYNLEEFDFPDATFCYDGKPHEILIEGMLPYGVRAEYKDNVLTEIGAREASVSLYEEATGKLLLTKTANLGIVENKGFANLRLVTETGEDPDYKEHDDYLLMTASLDNCDGKYAFEDVRGGIRVRGNSTNQDEVTKRAWRLKFDKKRNILGLNGGIKEKSWVLLADYFDQSMLRNQTAFSMGNDFFNYSGDYCSDYQHVNVYMNGDYRGIYLLAEQQQAKASRIPIAEAEENYNGTDVGYLIELDGLANKEDYYFSVSTSSSEGDSGKGQGGSKGESINGVSIPSKDYAIKTDVYGDEQLPFIKKYFTNVFKILLGAVKGEALQTLDENNDLIASPYETAYETLDAVIDMESFFKTYLLQEYMRNYDVGWGSFYFFVDFSKDAKIKKLTFGAPWDFDWSTGNPNSSAVNAATGDYCSSGSHTLFNPWLYLLSQTDFFEDMFPKYYSVFAFSSIYEKAIRDIQYESDAFASEFDRNYERWGTLNGQKPAMYTRSDVVKKYTCHHDAADFLLDWMGKRKEYMDGKYLGKKE